MDEVNVILNILYCIYKYFRMFDLVFTVVSALIVMFVVVTLLETHFGNCDPPPHPFHIIQQFSWAVLATMLGRVKNRHQ